MKRGLVFGKFLPLHRGHQLMIETALSQVDKVFSSEREYDRFAELLDAEHVLVERVVFVGTESTARRQRQPEDAAVRHLRDFLFCDTNAWTTWLWSLRAHGTADARLHELVDRTLADYTWILCDNDFGWVPDGTREMEGPASGEFQQQHIRDLERRGIPYLTVSGPVEERVARIRQALGVV